jgi:MFS family permease
VSVALDHKVERGQDRSLQRGRFPVLPTASLVSSLIMLDSNIVAVSLPAVGRSLSTSFTDIQWVISAYVLTYAALLLATGSYADLHDRRKAMLIGLVVFDVKDRQVRHRLRIDKRVLTAFLAYPPRRISVEIRKKSTD